MKNLKIFCIIYINIRINVKNCIVQVINYNFIMYRKIFYINTNWDSEYILSKLGFITQYLYYLYA